jgi:hypothetical protein
MKHLIFEGFEANMSKNSHSSLVCAGQNSIELFSLKQLTLRAVHPRRQDSMSAADN